MPGATFAVKRAVLFFQKSAKSLMGVEQFPHPSLKPRQVQWLGEKILRLDDHGFFGDPRGKRAHKNNGNFFCCRLALQNFAHGQPIQVRQQNVQKDEVGLELARLTQGLHPVIGHKKLAPKRTQAKFHQFNEIAFIIHNQDYWSHVYKNGPNRAIRNGKNVKDL